MPDWGEILDELGATKRPDLPSGDMDGVRRKYLKRLSELTGRNLIVYASGWQQMRPGAWPAQLSIVGEDITGLMQTFHGLQGKSLDLIMHSPGGDLAAAEAFVGYLRSKFDDVRVIVPGAAMSAACLIACSADSIIMGKHSFLGPIDPQFTIPTATGPRMCAAHAILEQFALAKRECADQTNLAAWLPMLSQFGPDVLIACKNAMEMSENLASDWLASYMFRDEPEGQKLAREIASWLSDHSQMKTHGRYLSRDLVKARGLKITDLEADPEIQDAVLSVFHSFTHCFNLTMLTKIIENHNGKAFMKMQPQAPSQIPLGAAILPGLI